MNLLRIITLAALLCGPVLAESRVWTSSNGRTVEAELVEKTDTHVKLKRDLDGEILTVRIADLSEADRASLGVKKAADALAGWRVATLQALGAVNVSTSYGVNNREVWLRANGLELLGKLGADQTVWRALRSSSAKPVVAAIRTARADLAKIDTPEAKTFLSRNLDPALAALDAYAANPAGLTQEHVASMARLAAALKP